MPSSLTHVFACLPARSSARRPIPGILCSRLTLSRSKTEGLRENQEADERRADGRLQSSRGQKGYSASARAYIHVCKEESSCAWPVGKRFAPTSRCSNCAQFGRTLAIATMHVGYICVHVEPAAFLSVHAVLSKKRSSRSRRRMPGTADIGSDLLFPRPASVVRHVRLQQLPCSRDAVITMKASLCPFRCISTLGTCSRPGLDQVVGQILFKQGSEPRDKAYDVPCICARSNNVNDTSSWVKMTWAFKGAHFAVGSGIIRLNAVVLCFL